MNAPTATPAAVMRPGRMGLLSMHGYPLRAKVKLNTNHSHWYYVHAVFAGDAGPELAYRYPKLLVIMK
jgi:hypothetical protein